MLIRDFHSSSGVSVDTFDLSCFSVLRRLQWLEGTVYACNVGLWLPFCFVYVAGVMTNAEKQIMSKGIPRFLRFLWAFVLQSIAPAAVPYNMTHFQYLQVPSSHRNFDCVVWQFSMVAIDRIQRKSLTLNEYHARTNVIKSRCLHCSCFFFTSRNNSIRRFLLVYWHRAFFSRPFLVSRIDGSLSGTTFNTIQFTMRKLIRNYSLEISECIKSKINWKWIACNVYFLT